APHGLVQHQSLQPRPVLAIEPDTCLSVHVRTAFLPPPAAEIVSNDERVGHASDPVAGVNEPPGEVDIGAVSEAFIEAADRFVDLAAEGDVDRRALSQVTGPHGPAHSLAIQ